MDEDRGIDMCPSVLCFHASNKTLSKQQQQQQSDAHTFAHPSSKAMGKKSPFVHKHLQGRTLFCLQQPDSGILPEPGLNCLLS